MEITLLLKEDDASKNLDYSRTIAIGDKHWRLSGPFDTNTGIPPYYCVSYVWGEGRVPNSIHNGFLMSDHTLPSLVAALDKHEDITALWIDAFCIPTDPLQKQETLERMGYIYSCANNVIVVLKEATWQAIDTIIQVDINAELSNPAGFPPNLLQVVENDEWIRSVWTYQEVVNSKAVTFVGQKNQRTVRGEPFLNKFGHYLTKFAAFNGFNSFDFQNKYPFCNAFEELILDWNILEGRSAFSVITGMHRRICQDEANYFYSMIGIITETLPRRNKLASISSLAETFLEVCEEQGDYSFIFCSNDRDSRPGLRWRPAPERFRPVISWASYGSQRGSCSDEGVRLNGMHLLTKLRVNGPGSNNQTEALRGMLITCRILSGPEARDQEPGEIVLAKLKNMGYTGSTSYSLWNEGLFFPQQDLSGDEGDINIWVSTTLRWVWGSPGIAIVSNSTREGNRFIAGVFVGICSELGQGSEVQLAEQSN